MKSKKKRIDSASKRMRSAAGELDAVVVSLKEAKAAAVTDALQVRRLKGAIKILEALSESLVREADNVEAGVDLGALGYVLMSTGVIYLSGFVNAAGEETFYAAREQLGEIVDTHFGDEKAEDARVSNIEQARFLISEVRQEFPTGIPTFEGGTIGVFNPANVEAHELPASIESLLESVEELVEQAPEDSDTTRLEWVQSRLKTAHFYASSPVEFD